MYLFLGVMRAIADSADQFQGAERYCRFHKSIAEAFSEGRVILQINFRGAERYCRFHKSIVESFSEG